MNHLFHIHTFRCGHASDEEDERYVLKALELGADKITFTDHCPFPGNPFGNRMDIERLDEYLSSLWNLKEKYEDKIEIEVGLEVEWLPSFDSFYRELRANPKIQVMLLGQHFFEHENGEPSFMDEGEAKKNEAAGCMDAMARALDTGLFDAIAHPDRCFRRRKSWTSDMESLSLNLIDKAALKGVPLEVNMSSYKHRRSKYFWKEFWALAKERGAKTIVGLDAHSTEEMQVYVDLSRELRPQNSMEE